jgi:peptidoglycan/LPS O-acetylase OafA/YrhL
MTEIRGVSASPVRREHERNNNFNLLRLVFATFVILSHSSQLIDGDSRREPMAQVFGTSLTYGLLGVFGFFLLSGYLVVQSWERYPRLIAFLIKRILRIYPAFIVASLVCVFLVPSLVVDMRSYLSAFQWQPFALSLVLLLPPPVFYPVFDDPFPDLNGPMWSLSFELRCYLLVAVFGLAQAIRWRWIWLGITLIFIAMSLVVEPRDPLDPLIQPRWLTLSLGSIDQFIRLTSLFFVGGCFYLFRQHISLRDLWVIVALLVTINLFCFESTYHLGVLTSGAYILFWAAHRQVKLLDRLKWIPDISYGLYLYGWPVQKLLINKIPGISPISLFFLAMVISAACGYLSWICVERWFLRLKPKPRSDRVAGKPAQDERGAASEKSPDAIGAATAGKRDRRRNRQQRRKRER